ncbi:MAG: hypothetical protein ACYSR9_04105 [Planctomycetota bacterium]|jgi:hypothetical protein
MRDDQKSKAEILQELDSLRKRVSEFEQAEQEIEELAKFPAENPNPVLRVTKDGTIIYANKANDANPGGSQTAALSSFLSALRTRSLTSKHWCLTSFPNTRGWLWRYSRSLLIDWIQVVYY